VITFLSFYASFETSLPYCFGMVFFSPKRLLARSIICNMIKQKHATPNAPPIKQLPVTTSVGSIIHIVYTNHAIQPTITIVALHAKNATNAYISLHSRNPVNAKNLITVFFEMSFIIAWAYQFCSWSFLLKLHTIVSATSNPEHNREWPISLFIPVTALPRQALWRQIQILRCLQQFKWTGSTCY